MYIYKVKKFVKISLVLFFLFGLTKTTTAQIQVYRGNGHVLTEQVLHFANNRIFPGYSFNYNDILYTVIDNKIMTGGSGSEFDLLYTFREGKLYTGTAMYTSQIAYRIMNGKIYKGDSAFQLDILYTVQNGIIFDGNQTYSIDALYAIIGVVTDTELFAILLSLNLIS